MTSGPFRFRNRILKWGPVFFLYGSIFILSSIPGNEFPHIIKDIPDLIPHFILFALLTFCIGRAMPNRRVNAVLMGSILGLLDEVHQLFVPNRFFSFADLGADIAGVSAGVLLYYLVNRKVHIKDGS